MGGINHSQWLVSGIVLPAFFHKRQGYSRVWSAIAAAEPQLLGR